MQSDISPFLGSEARPGGLSTPLAMGRVPECMCTCLAGDGKEELRSQPVVLTRRQPAHFLPREEPTRATQVVWSATAEVRSAKSDRSLGSRYIFLVRADIAMFVRILSAGGGPHISRRFDDG